MKKVFILIAILATATLAGWDCQKAGRVIVQTLNACEFRERVSNSQYNFYNCDNGYVSIKKSTGEMVLVVQPGDGQQLTLITGNPHCSLKRTDEYGVVIMNEPTVNGDEGTVYKKFKDKFL